MNTIEIDGTDLVVRPEGLDRLWAFRSELRVPLAHVRGATWDPDAAGDPKGIRAPGLAVPGRYVGMFHRDGERTFWSVSDPRDNVVIAIVDEDVDRIVATVQDPRATERAIARALAS